MLQVSLVYAEPDGALARQLGAYLELNCLVELDYGSVVTKDCGLVEAAGRALASDALILLLSPHSVPRRLEREEWEPLFVTAAQQHSTEVAYVRVADTPFPKVLLRANTFEANGDVTGCARALKRWILGLRPTPEHPYLVPEGPATGDPVDVRSIRRIADQYRCLVVLEGAAPDIQSEFERLGRTSVIFLPASPAVALSTSLAAETLRALSGWVNRPGSAPRSGEIHRTFEWLLDEPGGGSLACDFARAAVAYYKFHERFAEAFEVVERMVERAISRHDREAAAEFGRERAWILASWGRPAQAVAPFVAPRAAAVQLALW